MERLKNEFCSEMVRAGFTPDETVRALSALAITLNGYTVAKKDSNIAIYNSIDTYQRLVKLYTDCKRVENCSEAFCRNIQYILPKFFSYIGKGPQDITSMDVRAFLAYWKGERGISGATLDKYRQLISGFFAWLIQEGYMSANPCSSIKKVRQEQKQRQALSQMELEVIRSKLETDRERVLIEVLYSTGCRASELADIKVSNIHFEGTQPYASFIGKGNKQRVGYLNAKAVVAIKTYLATRDFESEYLFCSSKAPYGKLNYRSVEYAIKKIATRVGNGISHHLHPHLIRHTTATIAMSNGMPVQEVQLMLGHAKIDTTMIYAKTNVAQLQTDHQRFVV